MIYFDHSATTYPYSEVLDTFQKVSSRFFANPSSVHSLGGEVEQLLLQASKQIASILHVKANTLLFTSGGTEANNLAIKGTALEHKNRGNHIITTSIEHPSVLEACRSLEEQGFTITYIDPDSSGRIHPDQVKSAITDQTILLSIMHVNNELGTIQPIEEIADIAAKYPKLLFHVDHVQGFGKIPFSFSYPGIDLVTVSGHKIHGLKGTGFLYKRSGIRLSPLLHGGGQQQGLRSGTENVAGIVSLARAIRMTLEKMNRNPVHLIRLNTLLRTGLKEIPGLIINSSEQCAPHIVNFSIPGMKPEVLIHSLGQKDIFVSTKSACSSKSKDESAVLAACGLDRSITTSAIRVSFSYSNTEEEVNEFLNTLKNVIHQLKQSLG
ncbi:cysteine desulfurase family protein [Bacillaceae bacterium S4-13-56]